MGIGSGTREVKGAQVARRRALKRIGGLWAAAAAVPWISSCGGGGSPAPAGSPPSVSTTPGPPPPPVSTGPAFVTTLLPDGSLNEPWGMDFLPDGRMLVTQKVGSMVVVSADGTQIEATVGGLPTPNLVVDDQGGLLDVRVDPGFDSDGPWVYLTFSQAGSGGSGTAVSRARFASNALQNGSVIFAQAPKVSSGAHYGSRLAFGRDGALFVTLGERNMRTPAQDVTGHLGKVVRINRTGGAAPGNPAFGSGARPELWSRGHRNPQGAEVHPVTGDLWLNEHGPQGGDELNRVVPGGNYGWPNVSYGCEYGVDTSQGDCRIGGGVHAPTFVEPVASWPPQSIAPAGLIFYTGDKFPEWQGNALMGALRGRSLWRIVLNSSATSMDSRESLQVVADLGQRIRCVRQGPDGWIYLLTDSGRLLRLER